MEWVDDDGAGSAFAAAYQEVTGEVHAVNTQSRPARHFHVDHRQRDGDAGAPLQHGVQATVARVVIALTVAAEGLLLKEQFVQPGNSAGRGAVGPGVLQDEQSLCRRQHHDARGQLLDSGVRIAKLGIAEEL